MVGQPEVDLTYVDGQLRFVGQCWPTGQPGFGLASCHSGWQLLVDIGWLEGVVFWPALGQPT